MPGVRKYERGFGVDLGMVMADYKLVELQINHQQLIRFRKYDYPTYMLWKPLSKSANPEYLEAELKDHLGKNRIINSEYGNPYRCIFGDLDIKELSTGELEITTTGYCTRI